MCVCGGDVIATLKMSVGVGLDVDRDTRVTYIYNCRVLALLDPNGSRHNIGYIIGYKDSLFIGNEISCF